MPIYEFVCPVCHKYFERYVSVRETCKTPCIFCKGVASKIISKPASFIVKGYNDKNGYSDEPEWDGD